MTNKLRVLVAEGARGQAASALRELFPADQGGFELTEVSRVSTLLASLKLVSPEAILLELALGHSDVLGTVRQIHRTKPEVPLIVIGDPLEKEFCRGLPARGRHGLSPEKSHGCKELEPRATGSAGAQHSEFRLSEVHTHLHLHFECCFHRSEIPKCVLSSASRSPCWNQVTSTKLRAF